MKKIVTEKDYKAHSKERNKVLKWLDKRKTWPTIQELVTSSMIGAVIKHSADADLVATPEGNLIWAIINQAVSDADKGYQEARRFFSDGRLDAIAPLIGLSPQFIREAVAKVRHWA